MEHYNFFAEQNLLPSRLDKLLCNLSGWSRSKVQELIKLGAVTILGNIILDCNYKVTHSIEILVQLPTPNLSTELEATNIPLDIIYEDQYLLVINKAAGITVHPGHGTYNDTLVNALLYYCKDQLSSINGQQRPGIVHRLDRDTTGLMLVAKTDEAHNMLAQQIAAKTAKRHYLALVWGMLNPMNSTIKTNIGRSRSDRTKMTVLDYGGKEAITNYEVKHFFPEHNISLVECKLVTGRTHQIRVHLSHIGHSVVGDQLYGHNLKKIKQYANGEVKIFLEHFLRQALHAYYIEFIHPINNTQMAFTARLPADLENLYNLLLKQ